MLHLPITLFNEDSTISTTVETVNLNLTKKPPFLRMLATRQAKLWSMGNWGCKRYLDSCVLKTGQNCIDRIFPILMSVTLKLFRFLSMRLLSGLKRGIKAVLFQFCAENPGRTSQMRLPSNGYKTREVPMMSQQLLNSSAKCWRLTFCTRLMTSAKAGISCLDLSWML